MVRIQVRTLTLYSQRLPGLNDADLQTDRKEAFASTSAT